MQDSREHVFHLSTATNKTLVGLQEAGISDLGDLIYRQAQTDGARLGPIRDWHYLVRDDGDIDPTQGRVDDPNLDFDLVLAPHNYIVSREHTVYLVAKALAKLTRPYSPPSRTFDDNEPGN